MSNNNTLLQEFSEKLASEQIAEEAVAQLRKEYEDLTINGVDDTKGYKQVDTARKFVKKIRTQIEAARKAFTKPLMDQKAEIDNHAKRLTALVVPIEEELERKQKAIDDEKQRIEMEKIRQEQEAERRFQKRVSQLLALDMYGPTVVGVINDVDVMGYLCKPSVYEAHIDSNSVSVDGIRGMSDEAWSLFIADINRRLEQIRKLEKEKEEAESNPITALNSILRNPWKEFPVPSDAVIHKVPLEELKNNSKSDQAFVIAVEGAEVGAILKSELDISAVNCESQEGRWLMAAIAIITTECRTDRTPGEVLYEIDDLAKNMF